MLKSFSAKMLNFGRVSRKGTSLPETASFGVFCVKIRWGILAVRDFLNPQKIAE